MRDKLERVAARVNLRIHRGDMEDNNIILIQEYRREGLSDIPGEATIVEDGWIWAVSRTLRFRQYGFSGRCHVFSLTPVVYRGIPLDKALEY